MKHLDIAKRVGKSREYVSNTLRLLRLPPYMLDALVAKKITEGHTRPLLMLADRPEEQETLFKEITLKKMTVREAERGARSIAKDKARKHDLPPELASLEKDLMDKLGTRVRIEKKEKGGKVHIDFFSEEDIRNLLAIISGGTLQSGVAFTPENQNFAAPQNQDMQPSPANQSAEVAHSKSLRNDTDTSAAPISDTADQQYTVPEPEVSAPTAPLGTTPEKMRETLKKMSEESQINLSEQNAPRKNNQEQASAVENVNDNIVNNTPKGIDDLDLSEPEKELEALLQEVQQLTEEEEMTDVEESTYDDAHFNPFAINDEIDAGSPQTQSTNAKESITPPEPQLSSTAPADLHTQAITETAQQGSLEQALKEVRQELETATNQHSTNTPPTQNNSHQYQQNQDDDLYSISNFTI